VFERQQVGEMVSGGSWCFGGGVDIPVCQRLVWMKPPAYTLRPDPHGSHLLDMATGLTGHPPGSRVHRDDIPIRGNYRKRKIKDRVELSSSSESIVDFHGAQRKRKRRCNVNRARSFRARCRRFKALGEVKIDVVIPLNPGIRRQRPDQSQTGSQFIGQVDRQRPVMASLKFFGILSIGFKRSWSGSSMSFPYICVGSITRNGASFVCTQETDTDPSSSLPGFP
jgi:hypothetical protein